MGSSCYLRLVKWRRQLRNFEVRFRDGRDLCIGAATARIGNQSSSPQMKIETIAVHAGHAVDPATGAVAAPIYLSTTFERDIEGTYSRGFMYTRNDNPNRQALERGVSMLEGGEAAAAFASGTGATMSILQALSPGRSRPRARRCLLRHVAIDPRNFSALGTRSRFRRHERSRAVKKALRPNTKLAWVETPSNPLLKIVDLAAVAEIVRDAGAHSRLRQHMGAGAATAIRSRRRSNSAFDHEIFRRALRCSRRNCRGQNRRANFFSGSAAFNTRAAPSPRLSIAG